MPGAKTRDRAFYLEVLSFSSKVREKPGHASRQAQTQTLERSASGSATHIRHNDQFEYGNVWKVDLVFLDLAYCLRRAEVPLLADNLAKRAPAIGRPAQDELLRARGFVLFKHKRYLFQPLRLVKHESSRLRLRFCRAPAPRLSRNEGRLDRKIIVFRSDFNDGYSLDIEPSFAAGSNSLWCWGNKPFPHIRSQFTLIGLPAMIN